jgi:hypothetical protein
MTYTIKVYSKAWGESCAVMLGQGSNINEALRDAAKEVGASFRPKQDGRAGELSNIHFERRDGTHFLVRPGNLKFVMTPQALEDAAEK